MLFLAMVTALVPSTLAVQRDNFNIVDEQTAYFAEFGLICERTEMNTGEVAVYVKDVATNEIQAVAKLINGVVYLDGISVTNLSTPLIPNYDTDATVLMNSSSNIKWGRWSDWGSADITVTKYAVAAVIAVLAAEAPWLSVKILGAIASMVVAGEISSIVMEMRIRYGSDDQYSYYERETRFYGNGKQLGDIYSDSGKWIEGVGPKSL